MKKVLLWGLAIILALGFIGGLMDSDSETPISNDDAIVSTETPIEANETQTPIQEPTVEDEPK